MADGHLINHSPWDKDTGKDQKAGDDTNSPLVLRVGFPEAPKTTEAPKLSNPADAAEKKGKSEIDDRPTQTSVDTKPIYDIQKLYGEVQQLNNVLLNTCFDKQADGKLKPKDGKELIPDGKGGKVEVQAVQAALLTEMKARYDAAIGIADASMKDPFAVAAAVLSTDTNLQRVAEQSSTLQKDLASQGVNPAAGTYIDSSLVGRYIDEHKELSPQQREQLTSLRELLIEKSRLETKSRELVVLQESPVAARQAMSSFYSMIGDNQKADSWITDADNVGKALNSPFGRSEFMKRQIEIAREERDNALDKMIQEKYLKNPDNPSNYLESAAKKKEAGDLAGAKADIQKARELASKAAPDLDKDMASLKIQADKLRAEREALDKKLKDGSASPNDDRILSEKELKLHNEAQILTAFKMAKPTADVAYANFLLYVDKDKSTESNRKYARDILIDVSMDDAGKAFARANGKLFDDLMKLALNGAETNQASLDNFKSLMKECDALKVQASKEKSDQDIVKDIDAARKKADLAATIASQMNRDGANDNQKAIKAGVQKQIDAELTKPVGERDEGKVKLFQAIMKPASQLDAHEKELMAGLVECLKTENPDKALIDKLANSVKDKDCIADALIAFSHIQEMEAQKQAVNQARLVMLDIDIRSKKGENSKLVSEIENDPYGKDFIAELNALPGHDGRSFWGDIKEDTRPRTTGETIVNFFKGAAGVLKEVAISVASWASGAVVGVGVAGLSCWSGPGAVIAGGAAGFATGAAVGSGLRYLLGDEVSWKSAALDGISGLTGGVTGMTYAAARAAGTVAVENVVAQSGGRIAAGETFNAFNAASLSNKFLIAAGATRYGATFTALTVGSVTYRLPTEAITGNYQSVGDWAKGSATKIAWDTIPNAIGAGFGGVTGRSFEKNVLDGIKADVLAGIKKPTIPPFYQSAMGQITRNFLWASSPSTELREGFNYNKLRSLEEAAKRQERP